MQIDMTNLALFVLAMISGTMGWMLNTLWSLHRELSEKHSKHVEKVAERYVTKDDFKDRLEQIQSTCDNIWRAIRKGE